MTKIAVFTLGLPGSGKSTFLDKLDLSNYKIISADKIKINHPNYDPKYPDVIHEYSVEVAEKLVYDEAALNHDIVMDGGGINNHYTERIITNLKELGYKIKVYYINTPVNICIARNKERVQNGERFVPISAIIEKSYKLKDSVDRLINLADEFAEIRHFSDKNIFVDMDGVIAEYQELPTDEEGNINFTSHNIFINAAPVREVIDRLKAFYDLGHRIFILSASPNSICSRQKRDWLLERMSFIDCGDIYFVGNKDYKHLMLRDLISELKLERRDCTLIDDDHFILEKVNKMQIRAIHPSKFLANF